MSLAATDNDAFVKKTPIDIIGTIKDGVKGQPDNVVSLSCAVCNTKLDAPVPTSAPHLSPAGQQSIVRTDPDGEPDSAKSLIVTIAVLLTFVVLGDALAQAAGLPIPGAVVGLGLFFFYLVYCGAVPANIAVIVPLLLRHLSLLFIPVGVGAMTFFTQLSTDWLGLALTITGSTTLTLVVTATVFALTSRFTRKETCNGDHHER